jgi:histidine triad (HIT) family protein
MSITSEEASKIKEHLLGQLENFPEDKRSQITEQINSMTDEQVETFVEQNKLGHLGGGCVFCSIVREEIPSYKIAEDSSGIAVLELNPLSKGHVLIIPKEHLEEVPVSLKSLTQEVAKKLERRFSPEKVEISEIKIMNHALVEVIPIYGDETERAKASEKELKALQEKILNPPKVKIEEPQSHVDMKEEIPILPPRIP